jgi:hypothetical protein
MNIEMSENDFNFINGINNSQDITLFNYSLKSSVDDIHNYPNPFIKGKGTNIMFNVKNAGNIKIDILNINGV